MRQWWKENRVRIFLSSLITLLPILYGVLFWDQLPDSFVTHWGADGIADGFGGKAFTVFGIPLIFFALNLLCAFGIYFDKNNRNKNKKAMGIIFWIIPMLSILINCLIYKTALAETDSIDFLWLFSVIFGLMFVVLGNYLPKISRNRTMGIKIYWTLANEENWNKTHRLAGRVWIVAGLLNLATVFLPIKWAIAVMAVVIFVSITVPFGYSYHIYRKHKQQGIAYEKLMKTKGDKAGFWITVITVPIILIGVAVLMFTGKISYEFTDTGLVVDATYGECSVVEYDRIDSVEYRETFDFGFRNYGFASIKFAIGNFKNTEFGNYTLYSHTTCDSAVVIKSGERVLVINGKDVVETKWLYDSLANKIG